MDGVDECRINDIILDGVNRVDEFVGLDLGFSFCTLHFPTLGKSKSFPMVEQFDLENCSYSHLPLPTYLFTFNNLEANS